MRMTIELPSDYVGIAVDEGSKSFSPFVDKIFGRNMTNNMNQLPFRLRLLQLTLEPL